MREPRHASWDDMDDERVLGERAGVRGRSRGGPRKSAGVLAVLAVALLVALAVPADSAKMGKPELRRNLTRAAGGLLRPNIVGGIPVPAQDSYPWMANLYDPVGHWACGGAMIAPNIALTAGHCMASGIPSNWLVRTYRYRDSLSTKSEGGIIYTVLRAYVHPNYRESAYPWDYAVVILGPPTNYGKFTPQFIAINRDPAVPTHWESARTMGWGLVADGGTASDILRQVDIRTASPEFCKSQLGSSYGNPTYLCAGSPGKDSCQGDSGGPLVIRRNNQWLLVGLVSFGAAGCADPVDYLAVYSRISTVANWIDGIVASHPPPKVTTTKAPKTTMCTYCYAATCKRKAPKTKRGLEMVSAPMEKTVTRVVTVTETKTETATVCPAA